MRTFFFATLAMLCCVCTANAAEPFPKFKAITLDANVGKLCYAVTLADVDGDGDQDVVAVSESRVLWYDNPSWQQHTIIDGQTPQDNVCIASYDIDGDGRIDFALGAGWTKQGTIHWLTRSGASDGSWNVHFIGQEPWLHRMRFADVLGKGRPQLVVSPLNATQGDGVRLTAFQIPDNAVSERWKPTVISGNLNRMHNHYHADLDGNGTVDTLTASREGIHWVHQRGGMWQQVKLGAGITAADPNDAGAGEIKVGHLASGRRFLVTVEPMHGHTVTVYLEPAEQTQPWVRHEIATGFVRGHALWPADIDGDGDDEVVFGHSDTPETFGVIIFDASATDDSTTNASAADGGAAEGTVWQRHVVDSGRMACEDLIVADLTGDGKLDIVAGGRSTHNVKLYVQQPSAP
ncbi:FG-GAP repeat domain-containing protein [Planctomycetaceae bacterium SH139]